MQPCPAKPDPGCFTLQKPWLLHRLLAPEALLLLRLLLLLCCCCVLFPTPLPPQHMRAPHPYVSGGQRTASMRPSEKIL
jgi:hypothetical protein